MPETYEDDGAADYSEAENKNHANQQLNENARNYIRDCLAEKTQLEPDFPIAMKLIDSEILQVHATGRIPIKEQYADIYKQKTIKISQKIYIPTNEFPKFNFVGRLLGPGGNSLRRLQEETQCRILILGRNSMRDPAREMELRASADPKYAHLNMHLHVEVSCIAPPAEAYANLAYALTELRKYLIPNVNDGIYHEQFGEAFEAGHPPKYVPGNQERPPPRSFQPRPGPNYSHPQHAHPAAGSRDGPPRAYGHSHASEPRMPSYRTRYAPYTPSSYNK